MTKYILIVILFAIAVSSCKYSVPVLSNKTYSFTYRDTLTNDILKKHNYRYVYFPNMGRTGGYVVLKRYKVDNGKLKMTKKTRTKTTSLDLFEDDEKIYEKVFFYKDKKKVRVEYNVYHTSGKYRNLQSQKSISIVDGKRNVKKL